MFAFRPADVSSIFPNAASSQYSANNIPDTIDDTVSSESSPPPAIAPCADVTYPYADDNEELDESRGASPPVKDEEDHPLEEEKSVDKKRDKSKRKKEAVSSFIVKLCQLLEDPNHSKYVHWNEAGDVFVLFHAEEFSRVVLPRYFKHGKFQSFVRQLNIYGFYRVSDARKSSFVRAPNACVFSHSKFIRGRPDLLPFIRRRLPKIVTQSLEDTNVDDVPNLMASPASSSSTPEVKVKRRKRTRKVVQLPDDGGGLAPQSADGGEAGQQRDGVEPTIAEKIEQLKQSYLELVHRTAALDKYVGTAVWPSLRHFGQSMDQHWRKVNGVVRFAKGYDEGGHLKRKRTSSNDTHPFGVSIKEEPLPSITPPYFAHPPSLIPLPFLPRTHAPYGPPIPSGYPIPGYPQPHSPHRRPIKQEDPDSPHHNSGGGLGTTKIYTHSSFVFLPHPSRPYPGHHHHQHGYCPDCAVVEASCSSSPSSSFASSCGSSGDTAGSSSSCTCCVEEGTTPPSPSFQMYPRKWTLNKGYAVPPSPMAAAAAGRAAAGAPEDGMMMAPDDFVCIPDDVEGSGVEGAEKEDAGGAKWK
ncbi:Heat shock factor protein 2 [Borealophlyctis nickersoniae]|nr:Heat shock factor protein 2 [Borealophlyctis nickersoniae]